MDFRDAPVDQAELVRIRRQLHMYPETKWDLPRTTALVREELERSGIFYEADKYGPNTIVATINPQIAAFTIALRADMDALPIQERNEDKPYRESRAPCTPVGTTPTRPCCWARQKPCTLSATGCAAG